MRNTPLKRRDFLKISGIGAGAVFASGLGLGSVFAKGKDDFYFLQLSDTHWGFHGPTVNPEAEVTLKKAVQTVNSLSLQPDFVVFTGDLTHTTDDPAERRKRMTQFKEIIKELKVKKVYFLPGEHDASLDQGAAYKEQFGETHYTFVHQGVHFIALDNVSDPEGAIGEEQLAWFAVTLEKIKKDEPIVVLTHRPLFDLMPTWDWATRDGKQAIDLLAPYRNVTVFYGHIHQEHHFKTGQIAHHSAKSLIFPLPAPGSVPKKAPIPWDPAHPFQGLGFRTVEEESGKPVAMTEVALAGDPKVISVKAKKFEYSPKEIRLKKGEPIVLEFTTEDRKHGFKVPDLNLSAIIFPGIATRLAFTPDKVGRFEFHCGVFCGSGHEGMTGVIVVE